MIIESTLKILLILMIISIEENKVVSQIEYSEICFNINSINNLTLYTQPLNTFYTTRSAGAVTGNINPNKYSVFLNSSIRILTIFSIDKYDAGNGTYYSAFDSGTSATLKNIYNTLIFSMF